MSRSFDEKLFRKLEHAVDQLIDQGMPKTEAIAKIEDAFHTQVAKSADAIVDDLVADQSRFLDQEKGIWHGFSERLQQDWGAALDVFFVAAYVVAEAGDRFLVANEAEARRRNDKVFEVLSGLHGRGRRIAFEVHHLLSGGFPLGALARARTLHELAVIGFVIGQYGREAPTGDLAQRYLEHRAIGECREANAYQEHAAAFGLPSIPAEQLNKIRERRADLVSRYGTAFGKDNGWASSLMPNGTAPSFRDLEKLAELSHLRSQYQWMSNEVHAGPLGLALNLFERDGQLVAVAGPTNVALGDPGVRALHSLMQLTCAFFIDGNSWGEVGSYDLLALKAIERLIEKFAPLAQAAEERVRQREADLKGD